MSVSETDGFEVTLGDGSTDTFAFDFRIYSTADLTVYKETAAGVFTQQTIVADWGGGTPSANTCSVTFDTENESGTVRFSHAPANGLKAIMFRSISPVQDVDFPVETAISEASLGTALDKLTLLVQDIQTTLNRIPKTTVGDPDPDEMEISAPEDGKYLQWRFDSGANKWYIDSVD